MVQANNPHAHLESRFDTPGAGPGPSTRQYSPRFLPEPLPDNAAHPFTLKDIHPELAGMDILDYVTQTTRAQMIHDGGQRLDNADMLAIEAFNYKVNTDISSRAYGKLRQAFPGRLGDLPTEPRLKKYIKTLSGLAGREIHCCVNSCIAYTGEYELLENCPHCLEARFRPICNDQARRIPRRIFLYLSLMTRLRNLYRDPAMAQKLRYRAERKAEDNVLRDIFDGAHYNRLCGERVVVGGNTLGHRYFSKPTDIALGLSSNGFGPFKSRKQSCWPLLVFNYNLPPSIRTRLENMLCLGVIPGPNSPKEIDTFLEPFIDELELLARGSLCMPTCWHALAICLPLQS
ncbi:hypothetical protein BN14_12185 [Rhizoctonia solani AG-1 IB]|uniref:Transposase domain-containing protein n=1 Tax=Thanatephorus cucumeris (strain AG1-IB / isolate 7/3/14) TaxID=1108050 RepID=M5CDI3_THACB|nr:hypothetical protein BN14_12185 [Rhizoctonia solani AG-1 IB]